MTVRALATIGCLLAMACVALAAPDDPPQHGAMTVLYKVPVQSKAIALTFDLGCSARRDAVEKMLLSLDKRQVHCTWFVTGWFARQMPDLLGRIAERGDDLGNHTDTHPHCRSVSQARMSRELQAVEALLAPLGLAMTEPNYFRPPFGEYNAAVTDVAGDLGYRTVMWSATTTDYDRRTDPARATRSILRRASPGGIILMHATDVSRHMLPEVLDGLAGEGYQVMPLRELIHVAHAEMTEAQTGGEQ